MKLWIMLWPVDGAYQAEVKISGSLDCHDPLLQYMPDVAAAAEKAANEKLRELGVTT